MSHRDDVFLPPAPDEYEIAERIIWKRGYRAAMADQPYVRAISGMVESLSHVILSLEAEAKDIQRQAEGLGLYQKMLVRIMEEGPDAVLGVEAELGVDGMSEPPGQ